MPNRQQKRDSREVDRLINKANELINNKGYSILKACEAVGLQPTVYHFRKRKETALKNSNVTSSESKPSNLSNDTSALIAEAKKLEERLREVKSRLADSLINKSY